jgi:FixJ family two-component response regulator
VPDRQFLTKPYQTSALLDTLRSALARPDRAPAPIPEFANHPPELILS